MAGPVSTSAATSAEALLRLTSMIPVFLDLPPRRPTASSLAVRRSATTINSEAGLIGVEADVNGNSTFKGSVIGANDTISLGTGDRADVSGTIRGRAGLVMSNALIYVTGGAAWADLKQTGVAFSNFGASGGPNANSSGTSWGGVIGAGVEFAMSPNWTVGAEFLHTLYEDHDAALINVNGASACGIAANCAIRNQLTTDVARIRFNYKWGQ